MFHKRSLPPSSFPPSFLSSFFKFSTEQLSLNIINQYQLFSICLKLTLKIGSSDLSPIVSSIQYLVSSWWLCLGRLRRHHLSVKVCHLEAGEFQSQEPFPIHSFCSLWFKRWAFSFCFSYPVCCLLSSQPSGTIRPTELSVSYNGHGVLLSNRKVTDTVLWCSPACLI